jgi:PhnB protein
MKKNSKIPENYQTVMPYLILKGAKNFIEWTIRVFNATESNRTMRDEHIIMHAEIMIGECTIMFADCTEKYAVRNADFFVYVDDADATYKKAIEAGATVINEMSDQSYGRSGGVRDPFGNGWWVTSISN